MNAFFSGSLKVMTTTNPMFFPANVHKINGSDFDPHKNDPNLPY